MHSLKWDDLSVLLALARESTLTSASTELGINHTTVARRLAAAEEAMGARLFDRTPEGYVPTAAGEEVLAVAMRVEEEILSLDRVVLGRDTRLSGPLRVTTLDFLVSEHIDAFASFTKRYPNVELELSVDNTALNLTRREADVALRVSTKPAEHLFGKRVGILEYALYGTREIVDEVGADAPYSEYPWLMWDERLGARMTERWMKRHAKGARIACRVDTASAMIAAVRAGIGVQFILCSAGDADPNLVRIRDIEPGFSMGLWLLTHPDLRNTARVRAFMDHMSEELRPWVDRWAGRAA